MANRFQKFIYFLSAEAPIMFVFAVVWKVQKNSWKVPIISIVIGILLIILFEDFFRKAKSTLSVLDVEGSEFRCIDGWMMVYITTYLFPFVSLKFGDVSWIILGIILLIIMAILVFSDHVTPHPLLFFKGYHFYELKVERLASDYKVISKEQIRDVKVIKKVSRVFEFLLIRMR